jgi:flagellar basal-body rod protein FlgF
MSGGAYIALSGLRTRVDQLDRISSDLANVNTSGYKAERVTTTSVRRPNFEQSLETAIDVAAAPGFIDFANGQIETTNRDLDLAIEGKGFFAIDTPGGTRYTRAGSFTRRADGVLTTADGLVLQGDNNAPIRLANTGQVMVEVDGTVRSGNEVAGKLKIVDFDDYAVLAREEGARFRAEPTAAVRTVSPMTRVRSGALEQSNVSMVERMAHMTEVARSFEALQKGISVLMNDIDGRAITELGRR